MNKMKRQPTHPGKIIKEDYLKPLSLTITEMATTLGISRKTLSKILNERGTVTPDIALRLSRAFDTTPDLWQAEHSSKEWLRVKPRTTQLLHSNI